MSFNKKKIITLFSRMFLFCLLLNPAISFSQQDEKITIFVGGSKESLFNASILDAEVVISLLFNKVLKSSNLSFKIKIFETDEELSQMVKEGKVDTLFTNVLRIVALKEYLNINATYAIKNSSVLKSRYLLLVQKDSGISSLAHLKGKNINIANGHSAAELFLDVELLKNKLSIKETFFKSINHSKESNDSIIKLFFNNADVALVPNYTFEIANELNPQVGKKLKVLLRSDPMVNIVIAHHKNLSQDKVDKIEPSIWNIHNNPEILQIKENFRFHGVERLSELDIKQIQLMLDKYAHLSEQVK